MCMPCLSKLLSLGNHLALLKPKEHDSQMQQAFDRSLYDQLVRGDGAYREGDIHVGSRLFMALSNTLWLASV